MKLPQLEIADGESITISFDALVCRVTVEFKSGKRRGIAYLAVSKALLEAEPETATMVLRADLACLKRELADSDRHNAVCPPCRYTWWTSFTYLWPTCPRCGKPALEERRAEQDDQRL